MEEYEKKRDERKTNCIFFIITLLYILGWIKLLKILL